ncbi:MAG TPA: response regulator [Patescibacteria group bacterium]|nr:response regulator [Patescibacteria group bacterium]
MANSKKILIVEDDSFLLQMYSTKLSLEGFKIVAAADGEKALRAVKKDRPDLILLDLMLPKKDGFEVLAELKKDPETKDIPVVVLTNLGQKADVDRCSKLGAVDYLIKAHFVPSEVIAKIKRILENY